jgi:hypothetical protein
VHETFRVTWRVTPRACPRVWRNCRQCGAETPFCCSMKFRTNAQKKRLDVWLIYRCAFCGETWNLPIFERVAIGDIAPERFQAIAHNDVALAHFYAFDMPRLARHGERVEPGADAEVEWLALDGRPTCPSAIELTIRLVLPWRARLDRFLSQELGIGRDRLRCLHETGRLTLTPSSRAGLRGAISDNQRIAIELAEDSVSRDLIAIVRDRTAL